MAAWLFCPDYRSVWIVLQRWWSRGLAAHMEVRPLSMVASAVVT